MEIIKKNEINKKGILIEYDAGYISPKDNKSFVNEVNNLSEGQQIVSDPLIVYAVMQKYGVENKNERVYPEALLRKEAENYLKLVKEKRAMGEADHPESSIIAVSRISHNTSRVSSQARSRASAMRHSSRSPARWASSPTTGNFLSTVMGKRSYCT